MSCLGPTNPSTPTHVTIKNVTDTSFTITWSPPLCTGGVKLQEYLLFYDEQVKEDESSVNIYPPKEVSFHVIILKYLLFITLSLKFQYIVGICQ